MFKSKTGMYLYIAVIVLLTLLLALIAAYALDPQSAGQQSKAEKTEISVFTSVGDYTEKYALLNEAADEYMTANPGISVKCSTLTDEDFNIRLQTDLTSGRQPDIIITYPTQTMKRLFERGLLADLTNEFEQDSQWYAAFDKSVLQFCSSGERIFAAPTETEYILLYANKKILSQYGLGVPKTYEELKSCISKLADSNISPFAFGLKDENLFLYQALTAACGGSAAIESAVSGQQFTSAYKEALNILKELYNLGAFSAGFETMNRMEAQQMFMGGKAAFICESSAFAGDIENSMKSSEVSDTFTVLALPSPVAYYISTANPERNFYPVIYGAGNMTIFVSSDAYESKRTAVMDYIKYLTSTKVNSKFLSRAKYISALKDTGTVQKKGPLITQCNVLAINTIEFTRTPSDVTDRFVWYRGIADRSNDMFQGKISTAEIISEAERLTELAEKKGD